MFDWQSCLMHGFEFVDVESSDGMSAKLSLVTSDILTLSKRLTLPPSQEVLSRYLPLVPFSNRPRL